MSVIQSHVRMEQHVPTVRGAISVFVQPDLRGKIAPKVKMKIFSLANLGSLVNNSVVLQN